MIETDQLQNADDAASGPEPLDSATLADLLSVERRQQTIDILADGPLTLRALAEGIAMQQSGSASGQAYKLERINLKQTHLPRMAEAGVVDFDRDRGGIAQGPCFETAREAMAALSEVVGDA
jgi:predicted transcriptional regulator